MVNPHKHGSGGARGLKPVDDRASGDHGRQGYGDRDRANTTTAYKKSHEPVEVKLDLGCGPNKREGHVGIDRINFPGVDVVLDLGKKPLPYKADRVTSIWSSHFVEHLNAVERCQLLNECYRVLVPKGTMVMTVPWWGSSRAYGDPTHQWPPIGGFWFFYLLKEWRAKNAPHTDAEHWPRGYNCDFDFAWGPALHPDFNGKAEDVQRFAVSHYLEGAQDIQATLTKR